MNKEVVIIGAGVAGLAVAGALEGRNFKVTLVEKADHCGGHAASWDRLFPAGKPAREVITGLQEKIGPSTEIITDAAIQTIDREGEKYLIKINGRTPIAASAVVVSTGFRLFPAEKKEEYGYGIYDNVITAAELEHTFRDGKPIVTQQGRIPGRIAFIHCVGSRDEKAGNLYCSKVCCVTGVKQAIELREALPGSEVYLFYMDLRMYDRHFEELYYEAQQKHKVNFIRGRLSECAENQDHTLVIKTEDTLTGKPLKMTVDMVVLLTGFMPSEGSPVLADMLGISRGEDGFFSSRDEQMGRRRTAAPGVFVTGAARGPASIAETIADAMATAIDVEQYLLTRQTLTV